MSGDWCTRYPETIVQFYIFYIAMQVESWNILDSEMSQIFKD